MSRRLLRLCIAGPTASGKTAVAVELARSSLPVDVVSVDSAMVYRRMDIGTAKPDAATLRAEIAPHALIDIRDPWPSPTRPGEFPTPTPWRLDRSKVPLGRPMMPLAGGRHAAVFSRVASRGWPHLPAGRCRPNCARAGLDAQALHAKAGRHCTQNSRATGRPGCRGAHRCRRPAANPARTGSVSPHRRADVASCRFRALPGRLPTACRCVALVPGDREAMKRQIDARFRRDAQTRFRGGGAASARHARDARGKRVDAGSRVPATLATC